MYVSDPMLEEADENAEGALRSYLQRMSSWERRQLKDAVEDQIEDLEADDGQLYQ